MIVSSLGVLVKIGIIIKIRRGVDCVAKFLFARYYSPEILKDCKFPVLISSYSSQEEISDFILENYPDIEQVKLYDEL